MRLLHPWHHHERDGDGDSGKTFTRDEIRKNLSGHLCRCTGYQNIINGVEKAIEIVHEKVGE